MGDRRHGHVAIGDRLLAGRLGERLARTAVGERRARAVVEEEEGEQRDAAGCERAPGLGEVVVDLGAIEVGEDRGRDGERRPARR